MTGHREHPIIFSGAMLLAIMEGRKTQTRRVMRKQPFILDLGDDRHGPKTPHWVIDYSDQRKRSAWKVGESPYWTDCPYGGPGDRLWVKEEWWPAFKRTETNNGCAYRSDYLRPALLGLDHTIANERYWRGPVLMPRWASRIALEVLSVRAQQLQEITAEDAIAEGIPQSAGEAAALGLIDLAKTPGHEWDNRTSVENFALAWDRINSKRVPWATNPWVWVLTFRRLDDGEGR